MEVNPNSPQSNGSSNALGNIQRPGDYLRQIRITQKRELSASLFEIKLGFFTTRYLKMVHYKLK
jgi:hypothetical protein